MSCVVYWIHLPEHTDIFTQGYIGVTKNIKRRFRAHEVKTQNTHLSKAVNKYGWNNLIKEIILISNKAYCLLMEFKLRNEEKIGWNIAKGGGSGNGGGWNKGIKCSPEQVALLKSYRLGKESPRKGVTLLQETKDKISLANKGKRLPTEVYARQAISRTGTKYEKVTCPHCNKSGGLTAMPRWHFDNCKQKDNL